VNLSTGVSLQYRPHPSSTQGSFSVCPSVRASTRINKPGRGKLSFNSSSSCYLSIFLIFFFVNPSAPSSHWKSWQCRDMRYILLCYRTVLDINNIHNGRRRIFFLSLPLLKNTKECGRLFRRHWRHSIRERASDCAGAKPSSHSILSCFYPFFQIPAVFARIFSYVSICVTTPPFHPEWVSHYSVVHIRVSPDKKKKRRERGHNRR
jgi:hypothetical protein